MAVECTYCEEKINAKRGIYIKCTACQDIKLCLECFSSGVEIDTHQNDHPYELIDCGSFPIIDESWKAYEEFALLEAIELFGIGSWTDIANAVGTRSAEECSERYLRIYVDNFFGRCAWNAIDKNLYQVHDHTCAHNQPLSPSLSLPEKHKIVDISREQQIRLGYMPKRDDFEREYDNEAELLVSKLAVNANDDTELDQALKIAHINIYTDKLRERFRRKRIVLEYNLVKLFFHMHPEENGSEPYLLTCLTYPGSLDNKTIASDPDFTKMEKRLRIFCQFSSAEDHNRLIRNLAREKEVKTKIKELMQKRMEGTSKQNADPCWRLLSESEKRLCKSSNLKPAQYIALKSSLIKDHNQRKKKGASHKLANDGGIDKKVRRRIVDFLTRNNWIKV